MTCKFPKRIPYFTNPSWQFRLLLSIAISSSSCYQWIHNGSRCHCSLYLAYRIESLKYCVRLRIVWTNLNADVYIDTCVVHCVKLQQQCVAVCVSSDDTAATAGAALVVRYAPRRHRGRQPAHEVHLLRLVSLRAHASGLMCLSKFTVVDNGSQL